MLKVKSPHARVVKKTGLRFQASGEQADAYSKPQVSREMLPIHGHAWTCLSSAMFQCASPAKKFSPKIANEKNFLSTQQIQKKMEQQFYIEEKNKQVHLQIKMHLKNIKIEEYRKT